MTDLAGFLLARIAEDEERAKRCAEVYPPPWDLYDRGWVAYIRADVPHLREVARLEDQTATDGWLGDALEHIARWDPARVLAECDAKRQIVERAAKHLPDQVTSGAELANSVLRLLALPYAVHPDWREEWRP